MSDASTDWVPRALRGVALATLVLCIVGIPLALLPNVDVYRDSSDCFGRIFAQHGSGTCTPHYELEQTKHPGPIVVGSLVAIGLGALALRRWPSGRTGGIGALPVLALALIGFVRAIDFEIFSLDHRILRLSAEVLGFVFAGIGLVAVVVAVTTPCVALARAIKRRRAARPAPLPVARVVD